MPRLRKSEILEVKLPSFENGDAVVNIEVPATIKDFEGIDQSQTQVYQTATIMAQKIKSWNLIGEDDADLPITPEIILQLDAIDFAYLSMVIGLDKISKLTPLKKNS